MPLKAPPPPPPRRATTGADGKHIVGSRQILQRHVPTFYVGVVCNYLPSLPLSHAHAHIGVRQWMPDCGSDLLWEQSLEGESDIKAMGWRQHTSCARWPLATNCTALCLSTGVALKMPILQFLRSFKLPTVERLNYFSYSAEL